MVWSVIGALLALGFVLPLAWKWELGVQRVAIATAVIAVVAIGLVEILDPSDVLRLLLVGAITVGVDFAILAYRFYRDPDRTAPTSEEDIVVSPADGEVIYVRHAKAGVMPRSTKLGREYELVELTKTPLRDEDAVVIGIAMSFLDVHINRAPIAGKVRVRQHFPGRFGSLGQPEMVYENERATTVFERDDCEIAIVQIASRLVRQIASYVDVGENVALGQRVGVIRLGSQVDVVLPASMVRVDVTPGMRVRAGESILASIEAVEVRNAA